MFQTVNQERQRVDDLAERIKMAFQGELELDASQPIPSPIVDHEYHALRVKLRYFARASASNNVGMLFENGAHRTRNKINYIHTQYQAVTLKDLDVLAFVVGVEAAKGPSVPFRFGRDEDTKFFNKIPDPTTEKVEAIRNAFPEDFTDPEIVALCGLNHVKIKGVIDERYFLIV
eukprot:UN29304